MNRHTNLWIVGTLLIAASAACSGANGPTNPSVAAPMINGITDFLIIGESVTFTASGIGVTWGGDSPSIATVVPTTGVVTGLAPGRVTIWAENSGGRTTRSLLVFPSFNGIWVGTYTVTGCESSQGFTVAGFCVTFSGGQVLGIAFLITQSRDQVTGLFALGTNSTGQLNMSAIAQDGSLPLSGSITIGTVTIVLESLSATSPSSGVMNGSSFSQTWSDTAVTGSGRLTATLGTLTLTSSAALSSAATSQPRHLSLNEIIQGVLGRF